VGYESEKNTTIIAFHREIQFFQPTFERNETSNFNPTTAVLFVLDFAQPFGLLDR
jgi:hypothetical protein